MEPVCFFFKPELSGDTGQRHYRYKGYKRCQVALDEKISPVHVPYPVTLHFDRDEIIFSFQEENGRTQRLFSLYIAEGELNQQILIRKIENYWKAPAWLPPTLCDMDQNNRPDEFEVDVSLLSMSYFARRSGIDIVGTGAARRITVWQPFKRKTGRHPDRVVVEAGGQMVSFSCQNRNTAVRDADGNPGGITWRLTEGKIITGEIHFRQLLLDFLFELDNARTFEDQNFFNLQPIIQNNILLDALSRQCSYLAELRELGEYERRQRHDELPKKFREAERQWLNVCFREMYQEIFISADSLFDTVEEEVEKVFFRSRIGRHPKARVQRFSRRQESDVRLRNQAATFFLRQYAIVNAFSVLMPATYIALVMGVVIAIPFGDLLLHQFSLPGGVFSIGLPVLVVIGIISYQILQGINLFKLILPRMFLGIVVGWASFWETEEAWETALLNGEGRIILLVVALLILLCLYVFTNIHNKLIRVPARLVFFRTVHLVGFAVLISLMVGFYAIQFKAVPVLEVTGFLTRENLDIDDHFQTEARDKIKWKPYYRYEDREQSNVGGHQKNAGANREETLTVWKDPKLEKIALLGERKGNKKKLFGIENYVEVPMWFDANTHLYYIWSIHLSQFMAAIIIGVMLQLLWEDKAITEPL